MLMGIKTSFMLNGSKNPHALICFNTKSNNLKIDWDVSVEWKVEIGNICVPV